jgi:acetylornithine deacetylase/succinyl-diaminopimelate desuccinylase-like protein
MTKKLSGLVLALVLSPVIASAQDTSRIDWPRYQDIAVDLMQQYLRINTSNPPGNEIEAARFLKKIFDQHGIENEVFEYKPDNLLEGGSVKIVGVFPHRSKDQRELSFGGCYDKDVERLY